MYPNIKARFIQEVGTAVSLSCVWNGKCTDGHTYHRASHIYARLAFVSRNWNDALQPTPEDYRQLAKCDRCGEACPEHATGGRGMVTTYDTASGRPEPGDLYLATWHDCKDEGRCVFGWTNCDGQHLYAVLPNGQTWAIDSRASNCTKPQDTEHRCWVRHGDPPQLHVDKNGLTCQAGAGSIMAGDYHGFLHRGVFTENPSSI